MLHRGEHFPHNYNAVSRSGFYTWLNRHFRLGAKEPVIERDYEPLTREQLTVWDEAHPAPRASDPAFERSLLQWFAADAEKQLKDSAASPDRFREEVGGGVEVLIGRTWAGAGDVEWRLRGQQDRGNHSELAGLVRNQTHREELPVVWLVPKQASGRAVVWVDEAGKSALFGADGSLVPAVRWLVDAGVAVVGADLLFQGESLASRQPVKQNRVVDNPREFAGYTYGYNHALFAQRTHDVLTLVKFLRTTKSPAGAVASSVSVAGFGRSGPIVAAARGLAGAAIDRAAVDTGGFRFSKLLDFRDPQFLPGGAKYLDLPGMLALGAPHPLWLAGEAQEPEVIANLYRASGKSGQLTLAGATANPQDAAAWLLR